MAWRTPQVGFHVYYFYFNTLVYLQLNILTSPSHILEDSQFDHHLLAYYQFYTILCCNIFCKLVGSHRVCLFVMHF